MWIKQCPLWLQTMMQLAAGSDYIITGIVRLAHSKQAILHRREISIVEKHITRPSMSIVEFSQPSCAADLFHEDKRHKDLKCYLRLKKRAQELAPIR